MDNLVKRVNNYAEKFNKQANIELIAEAVTMMQR